ncbi:MAG: class I SAM-dependent methyltransferase [Heliomarina sp.]|uniref:class I SAM-dependent methyltransferase n=1 Tax=Heliomarina sp. TaxID=2917556 RepID=UPI004058B9F9
MSESAEDARLQNKESAVFAPLKAPRPIYGANVIRTLEANWEAGWLSPGGVEDLAALLEGQDISGLNVLDIGVGAGGPAISLLKKFGAGHVTGIDVERPVLERAAALAQEHGVAGQLELVHVAPGVLPFVDAEFDIVFSKDSFIHIADKALLFSEIRRILVPGGLCAFSDWCCGPPPYSPEMTAWLGNGMGFVIASIKEMEAAMEDAGFRNIAAKDRNRWFSDLAAQEAEAAARSRWSEIVGRIGADTAERLIATAERRALIANQGHLRPAHFIATAPG